MRKILVSILFLLFTYNGLAKTIDLGILGLDKQIIFVDKEKNIRKPLIDSKILLHLTKKYCISKSKVNIDCKENIIYSYDKYHYLINPDMNSKIKIESVTTKDYLGSINETIINNVSIYTSDIKQILIYNIVEDSYYLSKREEFYSRILDDIYAFKNK